MYVEDLNIPLNPNTAFKYIDDIVLNYIKI